LPIRKFFNATVQRKNMAATKHIGTLHIGTLPKVFFTVYGRKFWMAITVC